MDFFNYAGIHRPVKFYVTPTAFLLDISLGTLFEGSTGILNFKSSVAAMEGDSGDGKSEDIKMKYTILDADANKKAGKKLPDMCLSVQLTFTCSKSTRETLEKGIKYIQS